MRRLAGTRRKLPINEPIRQYSAAYALSARSSAREAIFREHKITNGRHKAEARNPPSNGRSFALIAIAARRLGRASSITRTLAVSVKRASRAPSRFSRSLISWLLQQHLADQRRYITARRKLHPHALCRQATAITVQSYEAGRHTHTHSVPVARRDYEQFDPISL